MPRPRTPALPTSRPAFTLVELIVVLAIIILLAGLLFPLIGRFKEAGKRTQCLSNLRALTQAWLAYAGDNDRHFCTASPGPFGWIMTLNPNGMIAACKLYPYLNDTAPFRCPDDLSNATVNPSSYAINGILNGPVGNPFPFTRLDDLTSASKTFVFIEQDYPKISPGSYRIPNVFTTPLYPSPTISEKAWPGQNHKGNKAYAEGTAISFADGHAIFWQYDDPRTGNLWESTSAGLNGPLYGNGVAQVPTNYLPNSPDVFQIEAWSGGPIPPNATQ